MPECKLWLEDDGDEDPLIITQESAEYVLFTNGADVCISLPEKKSTDLEMITLTWGDNACIPLFWILIPFMAFVRLSLAQAYNFCHWSLCFFSMWCLHFPDRYQCLESYILSRVKCCTAPSTESPLQMVLRLQISTEMILRTGYWFTRGTTMTDLFAMYGKTMLITQKSMGPNVHPSLWVLTKSMVFFSQVVFSIL